VLPEEPDELPLLLVLDVPVLDPEVLLVGAAVVVVGATVVVCCGVALVLTGAYEVPGAG
jgi:hypothetical protein